MMWMHGGKSILNCVLKRVSNDANRSVFIFWIYFIVTLQFVKMNNLIINVFLFIRK